MIRSGDEYRASIRDGREVWMNGERITDVTAHPAFKPLVDARARIYDMAHDPATSDLMSYQDADSGERHAVGLKLPHTREDWEQKRRAVDAVMDDLGGVVIRVGDETVGEMWSLYDGQDVLNEVDPQFSANIERHIQRVLHGDPFHVSANTDPKGDRSKRPQDQDPDMLLHLVRETDNGIVVRGAKYETAAAYANQAFVKPTIANWGDSELSDYALGFICDMGAPGVKHICRTGFAGRAPAEDYPLSNRFDEVDTLVIFDDVEIPWENVLFYRHTRAAAFIRATLHRYSAFPFVQRIQRVADMLIGAALFNVRQTGLERQQAVQEKLAVLACYREGINAHLTAAIASAQPSPGRPADAQPVAADGGPRLRLHAAAGDDAHRPRAGRRPDLRDARRGRLPQPRHRAVDGEVLLHQRALAGGGPPPAAGLRPRPAELRLRRTPADLPAVRPVTAVRPPGRGLPGVRLRRAARVRAALGRAVRAGARRGGGRGMKHTRIRPFNTRDTYPEQNLDNDLCQAVRAGDTIYLRGQIGQDLDTRESVGIGDVEAQAERAMANIAMLLDEAGGELSDIVKIVVYLTDVRYREPVYRVMGRWLKGVFPVSTGLVVTALARPEWVVEIDATAVVSGAAE